MSLSCLFLSTSGAKARAFFSPAWLAVAGLALTLLAGCGSKINRYALIEDSLLAHDPQRADRIVEQAEREYGPKNRVLYAMDRGITLHLSGQYDRSNAVLEQAEEEIDRLYTRRIRTEAKAFLVNDNELPYEGDPYEQVMVNVVKALNYAVMGRLDDALVEARRIDNRLNVLADKTKELDGYRDDGFARYLTGILYEAAGDLNNAFIAYRKAHEAYERMWTWSRTPVPSTLRADLLRVTDALHLTAEFEEYRRLFPDVVWQSRHEQEHLAQVVVISYNGRAPRKEDQFIDLPVSLDALQLVLLTKGLGGANRHENRVAESVLYGLSGRVVRVALPRLVPQKTQVRYEQITLTGTGGLFTARTELAHNLTALAEKALSDRLPAIAVKAVARAATKFAMAEGATRGAQQAAGKDAGPWVGLLVGLLTKGWAVYSEEADKRSWRTLPDEIHMSRLWVPPGEYELRIDPQGPQGDAVTRNVSRTMTLRAGDTKFLIQRVIQ